MSTVSIKSMTYTLNKQSSKNSRTYRHVLVVDDDEFNLEILKECLSRRADQVMAVESGIEAIELLNREPDFYDIVLLDRMMPKMSGIEVYHYIRNHPALCHIPVIMQTAAATRDDIQTGLEAGLRYYLSKPYNRTGLFSIMSAAIGDAKRHTRLKDGLKQAQVLEPGAYQFQTIEEVEQLALGLSLLSVQAETIVVGLYELLCNALEHGLLRVGYEAKTGLLQKGVWLEEIQERSRNTAKHVKVTAGISAGQIEYRIDDAGRGFDFAQYLQIDPARAGLNHGRGIAVANRCFSKLQYQNGGRSVLAITEAA